MSYRDYPRLRAGRKQHLEEGRELRFFYYSRRRTRYEGMAAGSYHALQIFFK